MTALRAGAASDPGRVRAVNEDSSLVAHPIFAVADGMGGHRAGDVASQVALAALKAASFEPTVEGLREGIRAANVAVFERASNEPELRGMGTTLCAVAVVRDATAEGDGEAEAADGEERIAVANVGDSRAYLFRDGELEQLTHDHTLVQTMVDDDRLTPEEAAVHPQRHIVTRALGIEPEVDIDTWEIVPFVGDRFLVCSDGLFNEVDEGRIAAVLRRLADPDDAARELVRLANEGGGRDNITVVVVDVVDDDDRAARASSALAAEPPTTAAREPDLAGFSSPAPLVDDTTIVNPVAVVPPPAPRPSRRQRRAARRAHRRVTWRVVLFLLLVLGVLGAAGGAVWWYGRNTYFVAFDGADVAVFRGRPGGFLWFEPTLVERAGIARAEVPASMVDRLEEGADQGTLDEAREFVANLEAQIDTVGGGSPAPTTTAPAVTIESTTTTS
ncbi:MAG TPA: PP2C family serine/threonine-protein phosphatase [Acidimicrobiales bacterium]